MESYLEAYFGEDLPAPVVESIASGAELAAVKARLEKLLPPGEAREEAEKHLPEAAEIRGLLHKTTEELDGVVRAMNGEYVLAAAGGDLLRDGPGVLPTGRNIHALDPYRMPSEAAFQRGTSAAKQIIAQHQDQNNGEFPETCAVALWGLDSIKTKGDAVAIVLHLVGAKTER